MFLAKLYILKVFVAFLLFVIHRVIYSASPNFLAFRYFR